MLWDEQMSQRPLRSVQIKLKCRTPGSAIIKKCLIPHCNKQAQRDEKNEWIYCRRHSNSITAPVAESTVARQRQTCQAYENVGDNERCTKVAQHRTGAGLMCQAHFRIAADLLPTKLIVISIDAERLRSCLDVQIPKFTAEILSKMTNLADPLIMNRPGKAMFADDTLQSAMHERNENWDLPSSSLRHGEIGCTLAHLDALHETAIGTSITMICEDDLLLNEARAHDDWKTLLIANTAPGGWGILRFGQHAARNSPTATHLQLTPRTKLIWGSIRHGTYGYLATPAGAKAVLAALDAKPELLDIAADIWLSRIGVDQAGLIKSLEPAIVKYRTDVVSTTDAAD